MPNNSNSDLHIIMLSVCQTVRMVIFILWCLPLMRRIIKQLISLLNNLSVEILLLVTSSSFKISYFCSWELDNVSRGRRCHCVLQNPFLSPKFPFPTETRRDTAI